MSFALSLSPQSHRFDDYPYDRSNTLNSASSKGTIRHYGCRQISRGTTASAPRDDSPIRPLYSHQEPHNVHASAGSVASAEHPRSQNSGSHTPAKGDGEVGDLQSLTLPLLITTERFEAVPFEGDPGSNALTVRNKGSELSCCRLYEAPDVVPGHKPVCETEKDIESVQPFKRWLSTFRRKKQNTADHSHRSLSDKRQGVKSSLLDQTDDARTNRNSSSHESSNGFVSAVRSATATMADTTIATRERLALRSSGTGKSVRMSQDSNMETVVDEKAWARGIQRQKILEELISSEESYIADLKVLVNVYFTLLASICALSRNARESVRENVTTILQMHQSLLSRLQEVVPPFDDKKNASSFSPRGHVRWHSHESTPQRQKISRIARRVRHSLDVARPVRTCPIGSIADPKTTAAVARVFESFVGQLFAYEEYGAKYEMMVRDLGSTYRTNTLGDGFDKGIEILSRTIESINAHGECKNKGLTFGDLVIKPIQRVCKYSLLFEDLRKHTPISDDPKAYAELEKVHFRLKEATNEINKARGDPKTRALIEKTWLLQDRLRFPNQKSSSLISRMLGHVELCGALYVTYQTKLEIKGQYMLCALFRSCFVLGVGEKGLNSFSVVASIPLVNVRIEDANNGTGLQCHTVPFSWKVLFQMDHCLFEIMLSACSPLEEGEWRKHINERSCIENLDPLSSQTATQEICSILTLEVKSIGTLYGHPQTLAHQISIHRAATVGSKSQRSQVNIRNTFSVDQISRNPSEGSLSLNRSHSMLSSGRTPTLSPRRSERISLELALSDVWTKDIIPFPGMRQSENLFKTSANHVMRKLSTVSLSSTISKRTSSFVSFSKPDPGPPTSAELSMLVSRKLSPKPLSGRLIHKPEGKSTCSAALVSAVPHQAVNFHSTPEQFLPLDFGLPESRQHSARTQKSTIRAVSDEVVKSKRPEALHSGSKQSASKLRKSINTSAHSNGGSETRNHANYLPKEDILQPLRPIVNPVQPNTEKENLYVTTRAPKPNTNPLRRFFRS